MLFQLIVPYILSTDCFRLKSQASYSAQRSIVRFTATPSKELVGEDKKLCEDVINGQQYELQIHLGNVVFSKSGLTYNKDNNINVNVPCRGSTVFCGFLLVSRVQTATYTLIVNDIDLKLTSIVNLYQIRRYNHLSCIQTANLIYDGSKKTMEITVVDPVVQCPCRLKNITAAQPPTLKNTNNVFIISKVGGAALSQHGYNEKNYTSILTFKHSNTTSNKPSKLDNFWTELVKFGEYNSGNLPTISAMLDLIRKKPVLDLAMRISLITEIKQNRDSAGKGKDSFYYNQSIEYSIAQLTNVNQGDCFTGVEAELHQTFFYINTDQNKSAKECSRGFIENKTNKTYDYIIMQVIASSNLDKSGFNYYQNYTLSDFDLGKDISGRFYCKDQEDCEKLAEIARLQRLNENVSVSMKLLFMQNESITFAISYQTNFLLSSYNKTQVSVMGQRICLNVKPHKTGALVVEFMLFTYLFDLSQYMSTHQTSYCSEISNAQQLQIYSIITKMRGNVDVPSNTKLNIGNQIVGYLEVNVYQVPKSNLLAWVVVGISGAVGIISSGLTYALFRKQIIKWAEVPF